MFTQTGKGGAGVKISLFDAQASRQGRVGNGHPQRLNWALEIQELRVFLHLSHINFPSQTSSLLQSILQCFLHLYHPTISLSCTYPSTAESILKLQEFLSETPTID